MLFHLIGECPDLLHGNVSFSQWNVTGDCYVRLHVSTTYEEAENIDSRLLSIRSSEQQQLVYNTMKQPNSHAIVRSSWIWLGSRIRTTPWMWSGKTTVFFCFKILFHSPYHMETKGSTRVWNNHSMINSMGYFSIFKTFIHFNIVNVLKHEKA